MKGHRALLEISKPSGPVKVRLGQVGAASIVSPGLSVLLSMSVDRSEG